jgi:hypothetical protein
MCYRRLLLRPAPAELYNVIRPWGGLIGTVELAPALDDAARARFQSAFGEWGSAFLVRPDGYVALAAGEHTSTRHLDAYCRQWLTAPAGVHARAE